MKFKKILIRTSLEKKLGKDFEAFKKTLEEFQQEPQKPGFKLEKLNGDLGYSIRDNKKSRIVLYPVASRDGQAWVVVDVLMNHEYEDTQYLKAEEKKEIEANLSFVEQTTEHAKATVSVTDRLEFVNNQFILFDDDQADVRQKGITSLPLIISGAPGSGKTSVLLSIVKQNLAVWTMTDEEAKVPRILVLAKSAKLVEQMRKEWADICKTEFEGLHVNPAAVEFKTPEDIYKEKNPGVTEFKSEGDFIAWYEQYADTQSNLNKGSKHSLTVGVEEAHLIYQEFYSMSGYSSFKDYNSAVSSKFSLFSDKTTRAMLWIIYEKYREILTKYNGVDLAFQPIELSQVYDLIGVDEAQDLSREQIRSLVHRKAEEREKAATDNLVFNVGDHQRLFGSETTLPFIRSVLWEKYQKNVATHKVLQASYRCPKPIIQVANAVLALKYKAIGGSPFVNKNELLYVRASESASDEGVVNWLETETALMPVIATNKNNAHFVVITSTEFMEEAVSLFGKGQVFTPESFKGLEAKEVLLYRFLEQGGFKAANAAIGEGFVLQDTPEIVKAGEGSIRNSSLFNQFFVAVTRAQCALSIYQSPVRGIHYIHDPLKTFILKHIFPKAQAHSAPIVSSKEEWQAQAQKLRAHKLFEQAEAIEKRDQDEPALKAQAQKQSKKHKKKTRRQLHVIEQVLQDMPDSVESLLQHKDVKTYLFHTPLNTINQSLAASSLVEYLDNPQCAQVKAKLLGGLTKSLENVCQWKKPTPEQQKRQDSLMELLYCKPNGLAHPLVIPLLKKIEKNSLSWQFIRNFKQNKYKQLDALLIKDNIQTVESFKRCDLLNTVKDNYTPTAAEADAVQFIVKLKELGVDIDKPNDMGVTLLYIAAQNGHVGVVQALVKLGSDIDKSNNNGTTPLSAAARHGHIEIVQALVKRGADINKHNNHGATPIFIAAHYGHKEVVSYLLANNADISKKCQLRSEILIKIIQDLGPTAIDKMKKNIINKIKDEKATLAILPYEIAHIKGHEEIEELIKSKMALSLTQDSNPYGFFSNHHPDDLSMSSIVPRTYL